MAVCAPTRNVAPARVAAVSPHRCQKAGTTSLAAYMSEHPQLFPATLKEVHYFDGGLDPAVDTFEQGESWYRAHFPTFKELGREGLAFEATPLYLFNPLACSRIAKLVPAVRLITVLRNPMERAISHYFHQRRKGRESLALLDAMEAESSRLAPALASGDYKDERFIHFSYKSRGQYAEQIQRYFREFPRERLLVVSSEGLFTTPAVVLKRVFQFLDVDHEFQVADTSPRNVASNRDEAGRDVVELLAAHFKPHNERLYEMLGRDFGW